MASNIPPLDKLNLEKWELQTLDATLKELVPLLKAISPQGMIPYGKMQAPQGGQ